jgi:hypothetical protein
VATDAMNDSEYSARWRTLAAQLRGLERSAGISEATNRWQDTAPLSSGAAYELRGDATRGDHPGDTYPAPLDETQRDELRMLYFSVSQLSLRKRLIAKQRELELFERTGTRTRLEDARRDHEALRRRPSEGWWIASIAGASMVIVGYGLFALAGAIAAGVAALFIGNGIEQSARRRYEQALAVAEQELGAAAAAAAEHSRYVFSTHESATGYADLAPEAANDLGARTH